MPPTVLAVTRNEARGFGLWFRTRRETLYPGRGGRRAARAEFRRLSGQEPHTVTWSKWENGHAFPSQEYMPTIEAMFGTDWPRPPMPPDLADQVQSAIAVAVAAELRPLLERVDRLLDSLEDDRGAR